MKKKEKYIRWTLREKLKNNRLARMDMAWVQDMNALI